MPYRKSLIKNIAAAIAKCVVLLFLILLVNLVLFYGCGSHEGGDDTTELAPEKSGAPVVAAWKKSKVLELENPGGLLIPHITSLVDSNDNVHFIYFNDRNYPSYEINHAVWDMKNSQILADESVLEIDNSSSLGFAIDQNDIPIVVYQGGEKKQAGDNMQADAMINVKEDVWKEYTGGIGFVERNNVFYDGLAGSDMSVVSDSNGDIHVCYQFYYEGVDQFNFDFPDLLYVKKNRSDLETGSIEETVEGNEFNESGLVATLQNNVGGHCVITVDSKDSPVVFYYAEIEGVRGLRVARKKNDLWEAEWIETGEKIGDISRPRVDKDGNLAVAYYVSNKNYLKYAHEQPLPSEQPWKVELVDDTMRGGNYCSLAFDSSGLPAIAYYTEKTHTLRELKEMRLARFDGNVWKREDVATEGDIGLYNSLWFDADGRALISTYSDTEKAVYIFYERVE